MERTNIAKRPHEHTRLTRFLNRRIDELRGTKTQVEIAEQAGYTNPNNVSMLRSGAAKLALDRVPQMAKALDVDPAFLLRLTLEQALNLTTARAIDEILGTPISANERMWIEEIRDASGDSDPRLTARSRSALRAIFGK